MRAFVRFRVPDGSCRDLGHGDLIGRLWSSALAIDDVRVSEAHAMVSLRGGALHLLALRGRFALDERPLTSLALAPGQRIALAPGLEIQVVELTLPPAVLGLEGPGLPRQALPAAASLRCRPSPRVVPRYEGDADAWIWSTGREWRVQVGAGQPTPLVAGDTFSVYGATFCAVEVALEVAGGQATRSGGLRAPLVICASFDTVQIQREREDVLVLGGISARILSELVSFGGPASWELVAGEIWNDTDEREALRRRWDVNLARLRAKLRHAHIREDLVVADGSGQIELVLLPGDRVEDRQ